MAGLADLAGSYEVLPVEEEHILEPARLGRKAHREGRFPGWADLSVGATALVEGHELLTTDPAPFEAIGCRVWPYREKARHADDQP